MSLIPFLNKTITGDVKLVRITAHITPDSVDGTFVEYANLVTPISEPKRLPYDAFYIESLVPLWEEAMRDPATVLNVELRPMVVVILQNSACLCGLKVEITSPDLTRRNVLEWLQDVRNFEDDMSRAEHSADGGMLINIVVSRLDAHLLTNDVTTETTKQVTPPEEPVAEDTTKSTIPSSLVSDAMRKLVDLGMPDVDESPEQLAPAPIISITDKTDIDLEELKRNADKVLEDETVPDLPATSDEPKQEQSTDSNIKPTPSSPFIVNRSEFKPTNLTSTEVSNFVFTKTPAGSTIIPDKH